MPREFDMEHDDGKPVPSFKPSWRTNVKDFLLFATVAAGAAGWVFGLAKKWVEAPEFAAYKLERQKEDERRDDRLRTIEREGIFTSAGVEELKKTTARIETKIDEKHRR